MWSFGPYNWLIQCGSPELANIVCALCNGQSGVAAGHLCLCWVTQLRSCSIRAGQTTTLTPIGYHQLKTNRTLALWTLRLTTSSAFPICRLPRAWCLHSSQTRTCQSFVDHREPVPAGGHAFHIQEAASHRNNCWAFDPASSFARPAHAGRASGARIVGDRRPRLF